MPGSFLNDTERGRLRGFPTDIPSEDLITIVAGLRRRGTGFRSLHEALDTTTLGGRLVFHVFAALAEFSASAGPRR